MKFNFPRALVGFMTFTLCGTAFVTAQPTPEAATSPDAKSAPAQAPLVLPETVATVNGEKISKADLEKAFNQAVQSSGMKAEDLSNDQKLTGYQQILDGMIMEKLVDAQSKSVSVSKEELDKEIATIKEQLGKDGNFEEQLKQIGQTLEGFKAQLEAEIRTNKWLESQIGEKATATEADAKAYYDSHGDQFKNPDLVDASHILFMVPEGASEDVIKQKEKAAQDAMNRAKKGEDFNELAKELSEEPAAKQSGGKLGLFSKEDMVPEFSAAAFSQKVGDIGNPVRTQYGFHVIKVTDKKPAGVVSFDEVKDRIITFLTRQKSSEAIKKALEKLRSESKVEVNLPQTSTNHPNHP